MIANPSFVPINLLGGIGDVVLAIDFLREMNELYNIVVYTKHQEALKYFMPDLNVHRILHNFAWHIDVDHVCEFIFNPEFKHFLIPDHETLYEMHRSSKMMFPKTKRTGAWESLGFGEPLEIRTYPKPGHNGCITMHDGYDPQYASEMRGIERTTKQWDLAKWEELVNLLKQNYPSTKIIQLGTTTSREIPGVDVQMINKTTISECFDVLGKSRLHIDGDSGLVHAASRLGVPCVVMWGPTDEQYYGWKENLNITHSPCASPCHPNNGWMKSCLAGHANTCVDNISAREVFGAASSVLTAYSI